MANDPVLSESVIAQSVAPSCSIRNFVSDEAGRVLMVPASSAPLNVSVAASTVNALSSSTSQIGSIANTSFTVGGNVDVGSINNIVFVTYSTQPTVTVSSANTQLVAYSSVPTVTSSTSSVVTTSTSSIVSLTTDETINLSTGATISLTTTSVTGLTTTSLVTLTSGVLALGTVVASSSNTHSVAMTSANNVALTTGNVIGLTSTSVTGLTTTSLVALTSSTLTIGVLSTAQVVTTSTTSTVGLTTTSVVGLTSGSAIPISTLGSISTVALTSSTSPQVVLAANLSRKGARFFNGDASAAAYLSFASTAAVTSTSIGGYNLVLAAGGSYDLPGPVIFVGGITGAAGLLAGSTITVTEYT